MGIKPRLTYQRARSSVILLTMAEFRRLLLLILLVPVLFLPFSCSLHHKLSSGIPTGSSPEEESVRKKYASFLGVEASEINNLLLYRFIDSWTGTPYLYGGKTRNGIDCSGFTETLYKEVYNKVLKGSSQDLFLLVKPIAKEKLREGDLVFFKIESDKISHVGIFLMNNKFVHATVHRGVMISDLGEAYYTKYFYKGGRLP